MKIYLSHSWSHQHRGKAWQRDIEALGHKVINPFYTSKGEDRWDTKKAKAGIYPEEGDDGKTVKRDLRDICSSDAIVIYMLSNISIGKSIELYIAHREHKNVYVITKKYNWHPFITYFADEVFDTHKDFIKFLKEQKE